MASIKVCDRDKQPFIERTKDSMHINDAVIYDENGRPEHFSGDLCPQCGALIRQTNGGILALPMISALQDTEFPKDE